MLFSVDVLNRFGGENESRLNILQMRHFHFCSCHDDPNNLQHLHAHSPYLGIPIDMAVSEVENLHLQGIEPTKSYLSKVCKFLTKYDHRYPCGEIHFYRWALQKCFERLLRRKIEHNFGDTFVASVEAAAVTHCAEHEAKIRQKYSNSKASTSYCQARTDISDNLFAQCMVIKSTGSNAKSLANSQKLSEQSVVKSHVQAIDPTTKIIVAEETIERLDEMENIPGSTNGKQKKKKKKKRDAKTNKRIESITEQLSAATVNAPGTFIEHIANSVHNNRDSLALAEERSVTHSLCSDSMQALQIDEMGKE